MTKCTPSIFDLLCLLSGVGIWPRYIEPQRLTTTSLSFSMKGLKKETRIALFSDLHWSKNGPPKRVLKKLFAATSAFNPDYLLFLGDFLCFGEMVDPDNLAVFLEQFRRYRCFTIFGNHDYLPALSINQAGDYDITNEVNVFKKALRLLSESKKPITEKTTLEAKKATINSELIKILEKSPFKILENNPPFIDQERGFALAGLSEISHGNVDLTTPFAGIPAGIEPITLIHNPDLFFQLQDKPTALVFAGHTHGGQINLPWIRSKLIALAHPGLREGLYKQMDKKLYITRGIGAPVSFRLFAPPELLLVTLKKQERS